MAKKLKIEKVKKRQRWNLRLTEEIFDSDIISGTHIEMFGNEKIIIDGCGGVYEYNSDYLKLKLKKGVLVLIGKNFDILTYENGVITVKGEISSVEFSL